MSPGKASGRIKILIIDDEESFCRCLKTILQQLGGYEVIAATVPHEGLQLAERYRPDLILLDVTMPEMDGFEVLDRLKRNGHTMAAPVLMLTGRIDEESKRRAANLCGDDFIEKPVGLKNLTSRIKKAVSESGRR